MSPTEDRSGVQPPPALRPAPDGAGATWAGHWSLVADRAMRRGDAELEGDRISRACASYLRAAQCYWLALGEPTLGAGERRRLEDAHVGAFRAAIPGLPHATTPFVLDVGDMIVEGYLFLPVTPRRGAATALWPVIGPATAESTYWHVGAPMVDSGTGCAAFTTSISSSTGSVRRRPPDAPSILGAVAGWALQQPGVHEVLRPPGPQAAPIRRAVLPRADR